MRPTFLGMCFRSSNVFAFCSRSLFLPVSPLYPDEYLNYALKNRKEWEDRGREVVDEMINKVKKAEWAKSRPASVRGIKPESSPEG